ncbi:MAG: hypothetical protein AAF700_10955 [Pseudomonadota bacterium]
MAWVLKESAKPQADLPWARGTPKIRLSEQARKGSDRGEADAQTA